MVESALKYPKGRFDQSNPSGGLILMDEENKVTQVVKDMVWKIGASILTGQFADMMKLGSPAYIHSNKSYLHMISKDMAYYEHYVAEAMKKPDDHVWKLKNVALAIISALHLAVE